MPAPYTVLMIDPPWPYEAGGTKKTRPRVNDHQWSYPTLPTPDIFRLLDTEVFPHATPAHNAFLWCLERSLVEAEQHMEARGYRRHARLIWDKGSGHAPAFSVRFAHEYLVWFYRGKFERPARPVWGKYPSVFRAKAREHSRKPDEAYRMVEAMYPAASRYDVFSRESRPGWNSFGNQAGLFDAERNSVDSRSPAA